MIDSVSRQRILVAAALFVLGIYALLSLRDAWSAQTRLDQARSDLAEVIDKITHINALQSAPRVAALGLETADEFVNRIAAALQAAGLPQSSLNDQSSSKPVRVQRSDFKLRKVTIKLKPATLNQIITFCDELRDEETGTVIRDLTLTVPKNDTGGDAEKWESELILTQMIFSPTSG